MRGAPTPLEAPRAIGRLEPDGPWIGFDHAGGAYRFIVGSGGGTLAGAADPDLLIALAIAHFAEAFEGAPPDIEATQADLSALVEHLIAVASDARQRSALREALDAIDDGLAGDAVAGRLAAAMATGDDQVDPVELLVARAEALLRSA